MLKIYHLTKTYPGGKVGVDDLSLEVKKGEIYGFIGHRAPGYQEYRQSHSLLREDRP